MSYFNQSLGIAHSCGSGGAAWSWCFACLQGADVCLCRCSPWLCTGCPRAWWGCPTTSCCALPPSAACAASPGPRPTRTRPTGTCWLPWPPSTASGNSTSELQEELPQQWSHAVLVRCTYLLCIYFPNKMLAGHKEGLVSKYVSLLGSFVSRGSFCSCSSPEI